jgi:peptidoglycan/xylan/chitin deacetylase (PgdA/CDA1 family)
MITAFLGSILFIANPPLRGDHISPFTLSEPGVGVFAWQPNRVTIISAFAYWCDTWKTQRERLMAARQKLNGLPVDFLAVSVDGQWLDVDKKANWSRRLVDNGSRWCNSIGIDRVPYTLVVDQGGTVQWAGYGISRSDEVVEAVRRSFHGSTHQSNTVFLSFDDFPAKSGNSELLDVLRRTGVHASLFVIGENAELDPKWILRAANDGNRLEVHGWRNTAQNSGPERCRTLIEKQTGQVPKWVRGPGSSVIQDFAGHPFSSPDIDPYDFLRPGRAELLRRIIGQLKGGSTLHLHAGVAETVAVLPEIIERGRLMGLHFEPLP